MTRHRSVAVVLSRREAASFQTMKPCMPVLRSFRRDSWMEETELTALSLEDTVRLVQPNRSVPLMALPFLKEAPVIRSTRSSWREPRAFLESSRMRRSGLIEDRIARLPVSAGDVFRWAAVLGTSFSLNRLA